MLIGIRERLRLSIVPDVHRDRLPIDAISSANVSERVISTASANERVISTASVNERVISTASVNERAWITIEKGAATGCFFQSAIVVAEVHVDG